MTDKPIALGGRGTEMFAGIPVRDFQASLEWYQRLFGSPPSFFPNDRMEACHSSGRSRRSLFVRSAASPTVMATVEALSISTA